MFEVKKAESGDSEVLTEISFAAKMYWKYPKRYFEIWKSELTITKEYISKNMVYVAEKDEKIIGYFSIVKVENEFWAGKVFVNAGFWLEHIFVCPEFIGKGIGRGLVTFAKKICIEKCIHKLYIFSDPNANGFYDKIGAKYIKESPSSIEERTVSVFELTLI